jgi:hypothetical protein
MRKKDNEFEDAERRDRRITDAAALVLRVFEAYRRAATTLHMQAEKEQTVQQTLGDSATIIRGSDVNVARSKRCLLSRRTLASRTDPRSGGAVIAAEYADASKSRGNRKKHQRFLKLSLRDVREELAEVQSA